MAELDKLDVSFRICGSELVPEEVTLALGVIPSFALASGETHPRTGRTQPVGVWLIESGEVLTRAGYSRLDSHLFSILSRLKGKEDAVKGFAKRGYRVDFYCACYMQIQNEGTTISPDSIRSIADLGAALNLSVWIPPELMNR